MNSKICNKCGQELPIGMFWTDKKSKDGYRGYCKECASKDYRENKEKHKEYNKEYYKKNKEKLSKKMKKHYEENLQYHSECRKKYYEKNRDYELERNKKWRENNREKLVEIRKNFYKENKDTLIKRTRIWRQNNLQKSALYSRKWANNNPDKVRIRNQRRVANKKQLPSTLNVEQWTSIKNHFGNKCAYCGKELPLAQEHFIPLSKGGEYTQNNIIPSCKSCNSSKGNKDFFEWYPQYRHYSKKREKLIIDFLGYKDKIQQLSLVR